MEHCDNYTAIVQDGDIVYDVFYKDTKSLEPGKRSMYIVQGITDEITKNVAESLIDNNNEYIMEKLKPGTIIKQIDQFIFNRAFSNKCAHVYSFALPF